MDDPAPHPRGAHSDDLAAIILGHAAMAPERVPVEPRMRPERGHDARSVAVLALVVAVIAALGGWLTSFGADPAAPTAPQPTATVERPASNQAEAAPAAAPATTGAAPAAAHGVDLAVGRVVASRTDAGIASVSVGVTNGGSRAYGGRAGAEVLLLLDGEVVASEQVPPLEPGADARVTVSLGWCPARAMAVTAVLDASAAVAETDERNNATTRSLGFGC